MSILREGITSLRRASGFFPRGPVVYVAPGTSTFRLGDASAVKPGTGASFGREPEKPLSTITEAVARVNAAGCGTIVLLVDGTYTEAATLTITANNVQLIAAPGMHPRNVAIHGADDGTPVLVVTGRHFYCEGVSFEASDAAATLVRVQGRYAMFKNVTFTTGGTAPAIGLDLKPSATSGQDASYAVVEDCEFTDVALAVNFGFTAGPYPGATNCWFNRCRFRNITTRCFAQTTNAYVNGCNISNCSFGKKPSSEYVKLTEANNGNSEINVIEDNVFADDAVTSTADINLTNTSTSFKFVANKDKAGFVTAI